MNSPMPEMPPVDIEVGDYVAALKETFAQTLADATTSLSEKAAMQKARADRLEVMYREQQRQMSAMAGEIAQLREPAEDDTP